MRMWGESNPEVSIYEFQHSLAVSSFVSRRALVIESLDVREVMQFVRPIPGSGENRFRHGENRNGRFIQTLSASFPK